MQKALERVQDVCTKARSGDALSIAIVGISLGAAWKLTSYLLSPGDGKKYMNKDQLALSDTKSVKVDSGRSITVRRVFNNDISAASKVLAESANTDPLMLACSSERMDEKAKTKAFSWIFSTLLKASVPSSYGAAPLMSMEKDNEPGAVALWFPNGGDVSIPAIAYHGGWAYIPRFSGWSRRGRFPGYSEVIRARRQRLMNGYNNKFYYLLSVAASTKLTTETAKDHVEAVLKPVIERADEQKVPCYAETSSNEGTAVRNALENLGFKMIEPFHLFGATVYIMVRNPKA